MILLTQQERDFIKSNWSGLTPTEYYKQDKDSFNENVNRLNSAIRVVKVLNPAAFLQEEETV